MIPSLLGKESELPASEVTVLNENLTVDMKKIKARERNSLAMAYLLTAFKSAADVSLAYETTSNEWPAGLAHEVVNKLKEAYQPKDSVTEVELDERLLSAKMKAKEDLRTLFEQVASKQNWYNDGNRQVPKEQLMAVVLRAAPKALGWHISKGQMMVCECCAIGKAKRKRVQIEKPKAKNEEVNGRIYLELSRIVSPLSDNQPKRSNWCMIVDEKTGYKTSTFHETKGSMVEPVCKLIEKWKSCDKEERSQDYSHGWWWRE